MLALNKLQRSFAADIWDERLNHLDGLVLDGRLPAERLFQVYRNNFWITSEDALAEIYPVIKRLVGDSFFSFIVDRFLRNFPPHDGNMIHLGGDLAAFLSEFGPAGKLPYLADAARLEWLYHQLYHAREVKPFDARNLVGMAAEKITELRFKLPPTSALMHSPFPIFQIWRVNQPQYRGSKRVDLDNGSESILLNRVDLQIEVCKLEPVNARFLQTLASAGSLGKATRAAIELSPEFDLQATLGGYLAAGVLVLAEDKP